MRVLALLIAIFGVLIPQLACFLPSEEMTQAEMDCCKHMAADCGGPNMQGHTCCPEIVRPDAAIGPQTHREFVPLSHQVVTFDASAAALLLGPDFGIAALVQKGIHAPPGDTRTSSAILRI